MLDNMSLMDGCKGRQFNHNVLGSLDSGAALLLGKKEKNECFFLVKPRLVGVFSSLKNPCLELDHMSRMGP